MIAAVLLIILMAALIGASLLAAKYNDPEADHPPPNAKADDRVPEDRIAEPFAR